MFDIFHGVSDKSESALRGILMAQARMRAVFVPVVVLVQTLILGLPAGLSRFGFACLLAAYAIYFAAPVVLQRHVAIRKLIVATAIIDPLMLTAWIVVSGDFGSVAAGFYVFTVLGFGFRTGRRLLYLCQIASIVYFTLVLTITPYWQQHPIVWVALMIPLVIVPLYASSLIGSLQQARELAELQSRAKSDLLAKVSHELRTPLTGIVATAELLTAETNNPAIRRRTDTILTLSDNLLGEINDLLDAAKYDAGAVVLSNVALDLGKKVEVLHPTFEAMAAKKGVLFQSVVDPKITDYVATDPHYLNRVLQNLCANAVKFTERGVVRLDIELRAQSDSTYTIRFSVTDTGIGIPDAFKSAIFQPFAQVDQGTQRRFGGTGLGLALSKKTVALMGGNLRFESTLGKGSRFWFDLTLDRLAPNPQESIVPSTAHVASPKRILVAEDNETNLLLLQEMLHLDHHEIVTCSSGIAALEMLAQSEFDLLLLDYNLGDMDGVRVLQTYQYGRLNPAPAIFLTADSTAQTASRIRSAGGASIVYKPVNLASLRSALLQVESEHAPVEKAEAVEPVRSERPALKVVPTNPLDAEMIDELRSVSSRPGFLAELLAHAQADIVRASDQLYSAIAGHDYATVANVAHALKGVSANVGAVRVTAIASTLMNLSSDEIDGASERLLSDLRAAVRDALAALHEIIAQSEQASSSDSGPRPLHLN